MFSARTRCFRPASSRRHSSAGMTRGSGRTDQPFGAASPATESDADAAKAQVRFQPAHGHGLGRLLAVPAFERFVVGAYAASAVAHFVIGGGGRVCPSWLLRWCWGRLEAGPDNKQPACQAGRARTVPAETLSSAGRLLAIPSRWMQGKGAAAARGRARRRAAGGGLRGLADDGAARNGTGWTRARGAAGLGGVGGGRGCGRAGRIRCRSVSERSPK